MPIKPENKSRYPKNWKEIRASILGRSGGFCEFCGVANHSPIMKHDSSGNIIASSARVVLTIAHLDHQPENCNPSNLRALCQRCHNKYDAQHRAETRKMTKASKDKSLSIDFR